MEWDLAEGFIQRRFRFFQAKDLRRRSSLLFIIDAENGDITLLAFSQVWNRKYFRGKHSSLWGLYRPFQTARYIYFMVIIQVYNRRKRYILGTMKLFAAAYIKRGNRGMRQWKEQRICGRQLNKSWHDYITEYYASTSTFLKNF